MSPDWTADQLTALSSFHAVAHDFPSPPPGASRDTYQAGVPAPVGAVVVVVTGAVVVVVTGAVVVVDVGAVVVDVGAVVVDVGAVEHVLVF